MNLLYRINWPIVATLAIVLGTAALFYGGIFWGVAFLIRRVF